MHLDSQRQGLAVDLVCKQQDCLGQCCWSMPACCRSIQKQGQQHARGRQHRLAAAGLVVVGLLWLESAWSKGRASEQQHEQMLGSRVRLSLLLVEQHVLQWAQGTSRL